jgi:hypothetical protein
MILLEAAFSRNEVDQRFDKAQSLRKQYLKLPDQKDVIISYHSDHGEHGTFKIRIFMRQFGIVLWDKTFSEDFNEIWARASFIPVIQGYQFFDLNNDGNLEIAVVVSHGGSAVWNTPAMIFTVRTKTLSSLRNSK